MIINNKKTKANPNAQIAMILGILIIIYFSSSAWMAFLLAIYSSLVTVSTYKIKYKYLIMIKMVMHIDIAN